MLTQYSSRFLAPQPTCFSGVDVIIVATKTLSQEIYWQKRLRQLSGIICKPDAFIIAIHENLPKENTQGIFPLFAYYKAQQKAKFMYQIDIFDLQKKGASVALYHNTGTAKSIFPIGASEFCDSFSIKLPGEINGRRLALLEAVIAQTSRLASQIKGRFSVFRADQIFIPSNFMQKHEGHHIEVFGKPLRFSSETDWEMENLTGKTLMSQGSNGEVKLLQNVDYMTFNRLLFEKKISIAKGVAESLESFSLSSSMTFALLREFAKELEKKQYTMNTNLYFWMPLTLDFDTYTQLLPQQNFTAHYKRMENFKSKFTQLHSDKYFFNMLNIGSESFLWNYGSTKTYYQNILRMTYLDQESQSMRLFYRIGQQSNADNDNRIIKDEGSCLINCNIRSGKITNCILLDVNATSLEAENCVIVNSNFANVRANLSLFYNVQESRRMKFSPGTIRADVILRDSQKPLSLYSHRSRDPNADWEIKLPQNPFSFSEAWEKILPN